MTYIVVNYFTTETTIKAHTHRDYKICISTELARGNSEEVTPNPSKAACIWNVQFLRFILTYQNIFLHNFVCAMTAILKEKNI